jgi:predicted transcriptional regulator
MIDALFGSKTRVKLLHLFLNNPGKSFYVREITRLIDEQINSVRRELSNMLSIGIITSETNDNKLYYEVNQRYEYYVPLRAIFADEKVEAKSSIIASASEQQPWSGAFEQLPGIRLVVTAGVLARGSASGIDILIVGDVPVAKIKAAVKAAEKVEGRELNYTTMPYEEFYYRLSVRDKFVTEIINGKHTVLVDTDKLLNN